MNILSQYKIIYKNGAIQYKNLISHSAYLGIIKPIRKKIYELESEENKYVRKANQSQIKRLKRRLIEMYGVNWFTDQSPLFYAIETGILKLLPQQGGSHQIKIEKI
jgi:hypothetical protein